MHNKLDNFMKSFKQKKQTNRYYLIRKNKKP